MHGRCKGDGPPFERKKSHWDEYEDRLSPERGGFSLDENKIFWKSGLVGGE